MPLVSRREYARLRGVSEKAVRKAIAAGKIPLVGDLVDVEIADHSWSRNRDGGQQSKLADAIATAPPAELHASATPPATGSEQKQAELAIAPLTAARIRNTEVSTAIKEVTRRKLEADLLEAEEVERTWGEMLQAVKDRLRLIPDNIGDVLAGTSDAAECRSIVMKEILDALSAASKTVAGMAA